MIIGSLVLCMCTIVLAILSAKHGFTFNTSTSTLQGEMASAAPANGHGFLLGFDCSGATISFLCMIYLCVAIYSCTWGTLGWIYPTELYSQGVRARALGISTACNWIMTYAVLQLTPIMLRNIYWRTYVIYAVFCLVISFIVYLYFPETNVRCIQ